MASLNFNAATVAPQQSFDVLPAGVYLAHITESDLVPTRTGGQMLKLTHEVLDGPSKGRKVWSNINIQNSNPEAERIGQSQLSALCHAVGVLELKDSVQLHHKPVRVRLSIRPAGPDRNGVHRDAQNEVKGYEAAAAGAAPQASVFQAPAQQAAAPAAAATKPAAPWAKRPATA